MASPLAGSENWVEAHLSAVAHDLRGPLSVISGHAQVLRRLADTGGSPDRVRQSAEAVLKAIDRMAAVLDELARTARSKEAAGRIVAVPVEELFEGALRGSRGRAVTLEIEPGLPPVAVDKHAFEHRASVMLNALRTGRPDVPVTVRVERRGDVVRVTLPDAWVELPLAEP